MSGLVGSARTFARELSNFFFNILPNQERMTLERKLEEVAVELGMTLQQIKTLIGFMVMAMGGYLIFLNIFFFLLPVVFLFIFCILVAVRDL